MSKYVDFELLIWHKQLMILAHRTLIALLGGILAGILIARTSLNLPTLFFSTGLLFLLLSAFLRKLLFFGIALLGVWLGLGRSNPILDDHAKLGDSFGNRVSIIGRIITDPSYHVSGQYEFFVDTKLFNGSESNSKIKVRAFAYNITRGDEVSVSGKLYDGFASWQGSMYFAEVELTDRSPNFIDTFRSRFIANVYSAVPDPEASLGLGFLIGIRTLLPDNLVTNLSATGLTHIVAVSGYNLTILVNVSRNMFSRVSRKQSLLLSLLLLFGFVSITGLSPSILRASIVSIVSLGGWYYGKSVSAFLLLLYSSSLSACINPGYVWYDIGWYLSLLAFFGILVIAPQIQKRIYSKNKPKLIAQIIIETSCAQIATLPIILYVFGDLSTISLLSNMVVLPLIPFAMLVTFLVGVTYFFSWWIAGLLMWPCYLLLAFIVNSVAVFASFEHALVPLKIDEMQMVSMYLVISLLAVVIRRRNNISADPI